MEERPEGWSDSPWGPIPPVQEVMPPVRVESIEPAILAKKTKAAALRALYAGTVVGGVALVVAFALFCGILLMAEAGWLLDLSRWLLHGAPV